LPIIEHYYWRCILLLDIKKMHFFQILASLLFQHEQIMHDVKRRIVKLVFYIWFSLVQLFYWLTRTIWQISGKIDCPCYRYYDIY